MMCQKIAALCRVTPSIADIRQQRGVSLLEMILAIAIIMALAPYLYVRITQTSQEIADITIAKKIVSYEARAMNYVRLNQDFWTGEARIEMDGAQAVLALDIEPDPHFTINGAFITKYQNVDGAYFEVFLDVHIPDAGEMRVAKIAKLIGGEAGTVSDGSAYGIYGNWSARSVVFADGDLVYRINESLAAADTEKFLHRTVIGDETLNTMLRDLHVGGNVIYDVGDIFGESARVSAATTLYATADVAHGRQLVFPNGANIDPAGAVFGNIRVIGDIVGFRNMVVRKFLGRGTSGDWSSQGNIVADRTSISDAVHVGNNLYIRSNASRTVSGFSGVVAHSLYVPYVAADEFYFANGYGVTVSSELMMSSFGAPLRLGAWNFPSTNMPKMSALVLRRLGDRDVATESVVPGDEFIHMLRGGWRDIPQKQPRINTDDNG